MLDFIQGNKFKDLTKIHYAPKWGEGGRTKNVFGKDDYRYLENTMDVNFLKSDDLIYTHTFFADSLFSILEKLEYRQFKVITHNSDTNVDFVPPDNITHWYTTNVNIKYPSIESIPIGIENDFWLGEKGRKMEEKLQQPRNYRNLVYMNFNIVNNPKKRQKPFDVLKDKSWVTTEMGENGTGFDNYLDNIYNHKFVVCPEGNGIDTHRIWECLYMGTIPITEDNINMSFYGDLPTLSVRDWEELNAPCLDRYFSGIKAFNNLWSHDLLKFEYWKNKIYGFSNNIVSN